LKILIAEDEPTSRMILTALLQKNGHEVLATDDGTAAWQAMQQADAPKMAILDWMMPGLEGIEVCRRIRALPTDAPPYLLLLSGKDEKTEIVAGLDAGADDYLAKPYNPGELRARVDVGRRVIEMQARLNVHVRELQDALDEVKTLRGMVPICAHCKKIRDDQGYWNQVEQYISEHSQAEFTHSICPECMRALFAKVARKGSPANP
jgi:phosphoserine phosphatase RsbU/P